ncbi:MAG: PD-(D/E)XK nuclease family protein [Gammaproteobacteria bacterium]
MHALNKIELVHYSQDILKFVSKEIAKHTTDQLPDLSKVVIFLPNQLSQATLREHVLRELSLLGHEAVFPPTLTTLRQWVRSKHPVNKPILSQYARELILVDAVKQQPDLFSSANPWGIANELLSLFDAMLLNDIKPTDFSNYYQGENLDISHALLHESDLVKMLWEAWLLQTNDEKFIDPMQNYANALNSIDIREYEIFYCIGLDQLSTLECNFLNRIKKVSQLYFYAHACSLDCSARNEAWLHKYINTDTQLNFYSNDNSAHSSALYDSVFSNDELNIKQRAEFFASKHTDPLHGHISIYKDTSFEQHTKAIDIQIRIWLNENKHNIGVVTTDRKLVRRLRAVLEHANISVNDAAGWALATTSAAVAIEWWLQLVEERYPAKQLLALSNSPFFPIENSDLHEKSINLFEKEIILRLNVHSGLNRYRNALERLQEKSKTIDPSVFDYLTTLLDRFEASAQLLTKLHNKKSYPLHRFIKELLNSLKPIGIYTTLSHDDAGKQIIDLFEDQIAHFNLIDNNLSWSESRRFMSRIFDQQNYKPPLSQSANSNSVTFCSLEQSRLQRFDALVIASMDKNNFPGTTNNYVFFNEQVRTELKIPTWRDDHARHLHQFRGLLDSSDNILITVQTKNNGEKTTPSPWLEAIETFYFMAYNHSLINSDLEYLVTQDSTKITQISEIPFPTQSVQPSPILISELKLESISISQYQNLINCPYQYFTLSCLKLSQTNELKEELGKADFGSLVHLSIHAFFTNLDYLPGPFNNKITTHNRNESEEMLCQISKQVFSQSSDTESNDGFSNELWLQRWLNLIPKFIDWEINRQTNYTPHSHEAEKKLKIDESSQIHGRLDRIDRSTDSFSIIDYKTGMTPTKKSILAGEQVQLPMYALLNESSTHERTSQVEYVAIGDNNTVKSIAVIKDEELENLKSEHLQRLEMFFKNLNQDTPFTALASKDTCERCTAAGVCRNSFWNR